MTDRQDWVRELLAVMKRLRSPEGCPWDREQTHQSLKPCLAEECAEFLDAVDDGDLSGMREELGDVLLHVVFNARIAEENGHFDFNDVAREVTQKLWRRHPHVFGNLQASNADEVLDIWRDAKSKEKPERGKTSIVDDVPRNMPVLLKARKVQKRVAAIGFDWRTQEEVLDKIEEEVRELREAIRNGDAATKVEEEIGDLLFAVVNLSRFRGGRTAEDILADAVKKFQSRFKRVEAALGDKGKTLAESSIQEMEALWEDTKKS